MWTWRAAGLVLIALIVISALWLPARATQDAANCSSYDSQIWAQSDFDRDRVHYGHLDPDGNGRACDDLPLGAAPLWWATAVPVDAEPASLTSVTDGDTIQVYVDGRNESVQLILIDAPEPDPGGSPAECFGPEATAFLRWLLSLGGQLYLETDVSNRDRDDRLLRYVWLDLDGELYLVNEVMVRSGYALLSTHLPDVKYHDQVREAAAFAHNHGYGRWPICPAISEGESDEMRDVLHQEYVQDPATGDYVHLVDGVEITRWNPSSGVSISPCTTRFDAQGNVVQPPQWCQSIPPGPISPSSVVSNTDPGLPSFPDCDPAYPDVCIPSPPPDLDCGDIPFGDFRVIGADPHRFDGPYDGSNPNEPDGYGCEWN